MNWLIAIVLGKFEPLYLFTISILSLFIYIINRAVNELSYS